MRCQSGFKAPTRHCTADAAVAYRHPDGTERVYCAAHAAALDREPHNDYRRVGDTLLIPVRQGTFGTLEADR